MTQIERIQHMEQSLDAANAAITEMSTALEKYIAAQDQIHALTGYYDSGVWREDYESDEAGKLPASLKRGVLSQDALYDLLSDNRELLIRMAEIVKSRYRVSGSEDRR